MSMQSFELNLLLVLLRV